VPIVEVWAPLRGATRGAKTYRPRSGTLPFWLVGYWMLDPPTLLIWTNRGRAAVAVTEQGTDSVAKSSSRQVASPHQGFQEGISARQGAVEHIRRLRAESPATLERLKANLQPEHRDIIPGYPPDRRWKAGRYAKTSTKRQTPSSTAMAVTVRYRDLRAQVPFPGRFGPRFGAGSSESEERRGRRIVTTCSQSPSVVQSEETPPPQPC